MTLTAAEQAQLRHNFRVRRPGVLATDTAPNVLYRVVATPAGRVYVSDLRTPRTVQRISVRDGDDEPWGDPVGYGRIPRRRRRTLLGVLWRVLTMKYRRVL